MPLSVRLDGKTEQMVKRLAHRRGRTRSAIVREAIARLADEPSGPAPRPSAWDALRHLIGVADSGGRQLSDDTGTAFRGLLQAKARARRSR